MKTSMAGVSSGLSSVDPAMKTSMAGASDPGLKTSIGTPDASLKTSTAGTPDFGLNNTRDPRLKAFSMGGIPDVELQTYSGGGIADRPQLALFGEGRKKEAYIPLEDGNTVQVAKKMEGGQIKYYVPLPSGKAIPVSMKGEDRLAGNPYMQLPDGAKMTAFASGGVMSGYGSVDDLPIRAFAEGGVGGSATDGVPYVPGSRSAVPPPAAAKGGGGNVYINVENKIGANVTTETSTDQNGDRHIQLIIDAAVQAAVSEVDRRIDRGGSTARVLKNKGVNLSSNLPIRK
jgi:hypothetical protein